MSKVNNGAVGLECCGRILPDPSTICTTTNTAKSTVLETTRTLFVWLVDLLLFYTPLGLGKLGESWNAYSWVQAAG